MPKLIIVPRVIISFVEMSNFELSQAMEKETIPLYLNLSAFNHTILTVSCLRDLRVVQNTSWQFWKCVCGEYLKILLTVLTLLFTTKETLLRGCIKLFLFKRNKQTIRWIFPRSDHDFSLCTPFQLYHPPKVKHLAPTLVLLEDTRRK